MGAHEWLDWRVDRDGVGMALIAARLYAAGQLYIVAHPYAIGDPYCTGCRWLYTGMMPGNARLIEVWNGPWFGEHALEHMSNEDGLAFYYRCLNQGRRLVMTAGSDAHGPKSYERGPGFNVVYADELSESAILRALAQGHHYLSSGPTLHLHAQAGDTAAVMMGDALSVNGSDVAIHAEWTDALTDCMLRLVVNGAIYAQSPADETGSQSWTIPANGARWCTIELRDENETMLAVTNPIFFDNGG
ncbi:MAG: CehA/McbA family metallohydrolase [Caldilineaceae bacterium]